MSFLDIFKKKKVVNVNENEEFKSLLENSYKIAFKEGWFSEDIRDLVDDMSSQSLKKAKKMFKSIFDKKHHYLIN